MTLRAAAEGFKKYITKSEMILRTLPKYVEFELFENAYKNYLFKIKGNKNFYNKDLNDLTNFPIRSFKIFPKMTLGRLITSSYEILKENKMMNSAFIYNAVLLSYKSHKIDFDVSVILKDMTNNNIQFNELTYSLIIELYCDRGDMNAVENMIKIMKTNGVSILDKSKYNIYAGYIRTEKLKEAKEFITQENIDENNFELLVQKSCAYADIGNFKKLTETLKKIKLVDPYLPGKISYNLYRRLVFAKAPESELDEILSMADHNEFDDKIPNLIFHLNRDGFFNHSLKLFLKFDELITRDDVRALVIKSFSSAECPINIYMTVLEKFAGKIFPSATLNLFAHMEFDTAFKMSQNIMTVSNAQCIVCNLLMKAVKDKSINNIGQTLQVALDKMKIGRLSTVVQFVFIPALLESKLISKPEDLLQLLPQHRGLLLPSLFMYFLCKGDFSSFDSLLENDHYNPSRRALNYINFSRAVSREVLNNVPFNELDKVALAASRVFSPQFVNWFVGSICCERLILLLSSSGSSAVGNETNEVAVKDVVRVANNFGATFEKRDIGYLEKRLPNHIDLIRGLDLRVEERAVGQADHDVLTH